jgi:argininosuccinate lyase
MSSTPARRGGPPQGGAAPELIASGFQLEIDDAPFLHDGLNLADLAHVLDLRRRGIIPDDAHRALLRLLLEVVEIPAAQFPYDPNLGEPYNSRERYFVERLGDAAGWLHAGRPRREAARVALRLYLRDATVELGLRLTGLARTIGTVALAHRETFMADQTYLQQAQPSTFGHYLASFAAPAVRDAARLLAELDQLNASPGGAGCVNGTRLQDDRGHLAELLGFSSVIRHTRDAMWRVDDLIALLSITASAVANQTKLAEDLEIFSSSEFDFVDLDDGYSRSSVLMPNKRNPYALSIVRGASGVLAGRIAGFLAVTKSPSARSDNFIFAYGEVPRALDLGHRVTDLMTGVIRTLKVNPQRMRDELDRGYSQATDLAEFLTQHAGVDYRTAYVVVGDTVRTASRAGLRGTDITAAMLNEAAAQVTGAGFGLTDDDLAQIMQPERIVATRTALGGAAPQEVTATVAETLAEVDRLTSLLTHRRDGYAQARHRLLALAAAHVAGSHVAAPPGGSS